MANRIEYFDAAKAICILLMIVGHCNLSVLPYLSVIIYSFHMPLFFIISGYFFKENTQKEAFRKYIRNHIKPYAITAIVTLGILLLLSAYLWSFNVLTDFLGNWAIRFFWGSGITDGGELFASTPIVGPIWFLLAIFWAMFFYNLLKVHFCGIELGLIILVLFCVTCFSVKYIRLPFSLQAGCSAVIYIWIGEQIRLHNVIERYSKVGIFGILATLILWILSIKDGKSLIMARCFYPDGLFSLVVSVAVTLLFINTIKWFNIRGGWIGRHTLLILCVHSTIIYLKRIFGLSLSICPIRAMYALLFEVAFQILAALFISYFISLFRSNIEKSSLMSKP